LERFDEYDFKDFLDEFTRQKIDFPAQKIVEWKKIFNKYKKQLLPVHEQISQTDKKIDRLVYELYGLDEPDILIVDPEELLSEK